MQTNVLIAHVLVVDRKLVSIGNDPPTQNDVYKTHFNLNNLDTPDDISKYVFSLLSSERRCRTHQPIKHTKMER